MNKSEFFSNFVECSEGKGFSFFAPDEQFRDPEKPSVGTQIKQQIWKSALTSVVGAALGLNARFFPGGLNSSRLGQAERNTLIADLRALYDQCDLVGIKLDSGPVLLRLGIDADHISDESLVARFAIVHERTHAFMKYASTILYDTKYGVWSKVATVFTSHERANLFVKNFASKCRRRTFRKKVYTTPWIIDLEASEITRVGDILLDLFRRRSESLKTAFNGNSS